MKRRLIISAKAISIFIGTMLFLAVLTHLFAPTAEGFANVNVVLVPFFVSVISSFLYMAGSMIKQSKEPFFFKVTIATNVLIVILTVFTV